MGHRGIGTSAAGDLVLDAGALIALERGDLKVIATLWGASGLAMRVVIPATALAQAWRGGPRSALISRLVDASEIDSMDEDRAKEVGVRLGKRGRRDVVDAHVVCCALAHGAAVASSDPADIRALADPDERLTLIPV